MRLEDYRQNRRYGTIASLGGFGSENIPQNTSDASARGSSVDSTQQGPSLSGPSVSNAQAGFGLFGSISQQSPANDRSAAFRGSPQAQQKLAFGVPTAAVPIAFGSGSGSFGGSSLPLAQPSDISIGGSISARTTSAGGLFASSSQQAPASNPSIFGSGTMPAQSTSSGAFTDSFPNLKVSSSTPGIFGSTQSKPFTSEPSKPGFGFTQGSPNLGPGFASSSAPPSTIPSSGSLFGTPAAQPKPVFSFGDPPSRNPSTPRLFSEVNPRTPASAPTPSTSTSPTPKTAGVFGPFVNSNPKPAFGSAGSIFADSQVLSESTSSSGDNTKQTTPIFGSPSPSSTSSSTQPARPQLIPGDSSSNNSISGSGLFGTRTQQLHTSDLLSKSGSLFGSGPKPTSPNPAPAASTTATFSIFGNSGATQQPFANQSTGSSSATLAMPLPSPVRPLSTSPANPPRKATPKVRLPDGSNYTASGSFGGSGSGPAFGAPGSGSFEPSTSRQPDGEKEGNTGEQSAGENFSVALANFQKAVEEAGKTVEKCKRSDEGDTERR